ncbi:MAG: hypothetical protein M3Y71_09300 [Actinomycetota bacterium]|nr:hypothetical protein [Actinomycetota bacterium]
MGLGELVGGVMVYEAFVEEPLDGAALGAYVLERVPARDELGVALMEPVLDVGMIRVPGGRRLVAAVAVVVLIRDAWRSRRGRAGRGRAEAQGATPAGTDRLSWSAIGGLLATTGEASRQRYAQQLVSAAW